MFKSHLAYKEVDRFSWVRRKNDGEIISLNRNDKVLKDYMRHPKDYEKLAVEYGDFYFKGKFDLEELLKFEEENDRIEFWACEKFMTIKIYFFDENIDKARELLPNFEMDLEKFPYRVGNKFCRYEWMIRC